MLTMLKDIYSILWVDLCFLKRHWLSTLAISLVSPLLYLVAFGYGLGRGVDVGGVNYLAFVMPGIIALTSMSASFTGASSKLHVDRLFYKSFDECLMSPISLFSIVIGKALIGVVRGLLSSVAILIVGIILSPLLIVSPLLILVLIMSCLVFALFGVFIALVISSHQAMSTFSNLVILPMTFLSGTFFSLSQLPEAVKVVLYLLPLTHSSESLRAVALGQPFPWLSFLALLGFALFFFSACMVALKRASV
ncbi:MAG: ABC transporter permease [Candidatus Bathyarchaeota archaeon]|nr:ABC transporter permease [Candidatus Bathyarchaeota archaeon]